MTFWLPVDGAQAAAAAVRPVATGASAASSSSTTRPTCASWSPTCWPGTATASPWRAGGREGLARFETGRYDLVLTDLGMPDLNGWEVARASRPRAPTSPVLLLTGWADAVDPADGRASTAILKKPFGLES